MQQIEKLLVSFRKKLKDSGLQPATVESYSRDAHGFLHFLNEKGAPLSEFQISDLEEYQSHLRSNTGRSNSVRRATIGIRQFLRHWSSDQNLISSPFDDVPIPKREDHFLNTLIAQDIEKLFAALKETTPEIKARRDRALLALLCYEGLKATEVIELKWSSYLAPTLQLKSSRPRVIQLSDTTLQMMNDYRKEYQKLDLGEGGNKNIFISFKGKESQTISPKMTRHGLKFMLTEMGNTALDRGISSEELRHAAIDFQIENGKSPEEIMNHLGLRTLGIIAAHLQKEPQTDG